MNGHFILYTLQKLIITNLRKKITIKKFKILLTSKTCIKLIGMNGYFSCFEHFPWFSRNGGRFGKVVFPVYTKKSNKLNKFNWIKSNNVEAHIVYRPVISRNLVGFNWLDYASVNSVSNWLRAIFTELGEYILQNPVRKVIFRQYKTWRGYQASIGKNEHQFSDLAVIISFILSQGQFRFTIFYTGFFCWPIFHYVFDLLTGNVKTETI